MGDAPTTLHMPKKEDELDYCLDMPPGFRFHPTDAEIILSYLMEKVKDHSFASVAIGEVDLNSCEPWDLPRRAKMGEKEWWFFWHRDRKYPTGTRTNRATESGYWKATGKDKEIYKGKGCLVGMKKTLVFYLGRAPRGGKTNWVMHEYRLDGKSLHNHISRSSKNDWVVCRVFHKNEPKKNVEGEISRSNCLSLNTSYGVDRSTLPPLSESSPTYTDNISMPSSGFVPDLSICTAPWMSTYPNINPFFLDIPLMPTINPNPPNYYDLPPPTQFAEQGDVEYLHHDHVETRDALKGKCKIEEQPLPSRSTVETSGRTWDDPGSPSCSVGPLANLDEYLWSN